MNDYSRDLVAAATKPFLLSILAQGENYGYDIIRRVHHLTEGRLQWSDGIIYPVLHKMEEQKYIASRWVRMENKKRRKYYHITQKGLLELEKVKKDWKELSYFLDRTWEASSCLV